jgi:hypothetical protein
MSDLIMAHGAGLAGEESLVLFPFATTGDYDGEEDAEILERQ